MKVRFLADYRGVLTGEEYFPAGAVIDVDNATVLVKAGRAEYVEPPEQIKPESVKAVDYEGLSVKQLKDKAKAAGVIGFGRMKRETLIKKLEVINNARSD